MEENNESTERKNEKEYVGRKIAVSVTAGIAAMLLFLAAVSVIERNKSTGPYEGAGMYYASSVSSAGLVLPYGEKERMTVELFPDGKCTVSVGQKSEKGRWKRVGDRIEITMGSLVLEGTADDSSITLTSEITEGTVLTLEKENAENKELKIPAGEWTLSSITYGSDVYSSDVLAQTGYGRGYININIDGSGTAEFLDEKDDGIRVDGEYVSFNGRLMRYFTENEKLCVQYSEDVIIRFEKITYPLSVG